MAKGDPSHRPPILPILSRLWRYAFSINHVQGHKTCKTGWMTKRSRWHARARPAVALQEQQPAGSLEIAQ
eukprot:358278-Chlamydomonas_euryale.AAC.2